MTEFIRVANEVAYTAGTPGTEETVFNFSDDSANNNVYSLSVWLYAA